MPIRSVVQLFYYRRMRPVLANILGKRANFPGAFTLFAGGMLKPKTSPVLQFLGDAFLAKRDIACSECFRVRIECDSRRGVYPCILTKSPPRDFFGRFSGEKGIAIRAFSATRTAQLPPATRGVSARRITPQGPHHRARAESGPRRAPTADSHDPGTAQSSGVRSAQAASGSFPHRSRSASCNQRVSA